MTDNASAGRKTRSNGHTPVETGVSRRAVLRTAGLAAVGGAVTAGTSSADSDQPGSGRETTYGPPERLGNGNVRTFVTRTPEGDPQYVGVWMRESALEGLPSVEEMRAPFKSVHLEMPPDSQDDLPFTNVEVGWNPAGHAPREIYGRPHFDFHFNLLDESVTRRIPFGVAAYDIPDDQLPSDYRTSAAAGFPRLIYPREGEHLADFTSPEFRGGEFTHTFTWGAYDPGIDPLDPVEFRVVPVEIPGVGRVPLPAPVYRGDGTGRLSFLEPMITSAFLRGHEGAVRTEIRQPETYPEPGWYPGQYGIWHLPEKSAYAITLEAFNQVEV